MFKSRKHQASAHEVWLLNEMSGAGLHFRGAALHLLSSSRAWLGDAWLHFQGSCCPCLKHQPRVALAPVSCPSSPVCVSQT